MRVDWAKLVPTVKVDKYEWPSVGAELTLRFVGPGFGIGLWKRDIWIGWPPQSSLCPDDCPHHKAPVKAEEDQEG